MMTMQRLLDTGATTSVLGRDSNMIWHEENSEQQKKSCVRTANRQPMRFGRKIKVKMKFNGIRKPIKMLKILKTMKTMTDKLEFKKYYA